MTGDTSQRRPVDSDKPWRVVRYGLRHKTTVRAFRRRWTAHMWRALKHWPVLGMYKVEANPPTEGD